MARSENGLHIFTNGIFNEIEPSDDSERAYLESLIKSDYERSHPGETFEDLKHRARFSKDDKGLLRDWMALAVERAAARSKVKTNAGSSAAGQ